MGIREQLSDPWGFVAGGVSGGIAGAMVAASVGFIPALPVGLGVAALVYGVKVAVGAMTDPSSPATPSIAGPMPRRGSPADVWLRRAEAAVRTLHEQTESPHDAATRAQVGDVDEAAAETLTDLRRLASQVASVEAAGARIDIDRLRAEQQRLALAVQAAADPDLRAEHERAARSINEQIEVYGRLLVARDTLVARMQNTAIGLEGLIARLAEVLALAATAGGVDTMAQRIGDLSSELDGMQAGLRETEALSRKVLAQNGPEPAS